MPGHCESDVKCLFSLGPPYWVYPTTQDVEKDGFQSDLPAVV